MTEKSEEVAETDGKGSLSIKRQRFCEFMLVCSSATKAAIAAKYTEKSAHVTACRLLKNDNVQAEISRLRIIAAEKADIKPEQVIYGVQFDIDVSREKGNMTAVLNGWKMLGQYLAMWKEGLEAKPPDDSNYHQNFATLALAGAKGDRPLARRIFRGFLLKMGSDDVFGPPMSDEDIDTLLNEAAGH